MKNEKNTSAETLPQGAPIDQVEQNQTAEGERIRPREERTAEIIGWIERDIQSVITILSVFLAPEHKETIHKMANFMLDELEKQENPAE